MEVFNRHAWGGQVEWHSNTPRDSDGSDAYTGDGYATHGTEYPTHTHWQTGYSHTPQNDPIPDDATKTAIGHVGGGRTSFCMIDNPHFTHH